MPVYCVLRTANLFRFHGPINPLQRHPGWSPSGWNFRKRAEMCRPGLHEKAIIVDFIHDAGSVLDDVREEARIDKGRRKRLV